MRKIILAGVCLQADSSSFISAMQECEALCNACDLEVLGTITPTIKEYGSTYRIPCRKIRNSESDV